MLKTNALKVDSPPWMELSEALRSKLSSSSVGCSFDIVVRCHIRLNDTQFSSISNANGPASVPSSSSSNRTARLSKAERKQMKKNGGVKLHTNCNGGSSAHIKMDDSTKDNTNIQSIAPKYNESLCIALKKSNLNGDVVFKLSSPQDVCHSYVDILNML